MEQQVQFKIRASLEERIMIAYRLLSVVMERGTPVVIEILINLSF